MRKRLTEPLIEGLPAKSKRYLVYDTTVQGLAIRVARTGRKTFCLVGRFDSIHPTRRSIGTYGRTSLEEARQKALEFQQRRVLPQKSQSFRSVAEQYFKYIEHQRRAREFIRVVRREFIPRWADRPLNEIQRADVLKVIDAAIARGSPYAAHHAWAYIRRIFNWAIARGILEHSPCDRVRARDIIGEKVPRHRVLTDDELRNLWHAGDALGYPMGAYFQFLLVTGQRKSEVGNARRCEFDLTAKLWRLPSSRMKAGAPHLVPLSPVAISIVEALPKHEGFLFSTTGGTKPVNGFTKAKHRLDATMGVEEPFVIHDIRRTVRTRLSQLRVRSEVAEMVIGHGKKGLARVYDQHQYLDEMREALDLWARELLRIAHGGDSEPRPETSGVNPEAAQSA
jgi:integrase